MNGDLVCYLVPSWKRTGTVLPKLSVGGGESPEANRERVKGKMTPTLRNMETDG